MKLPIPADWNGTSWRCVQVQWPDSPLYLALLHGFLSQLARGRTWDENTGSIVDAQAVGKAIWEASTPLVDCEGVIIPPTPTTPEIGPFLGFLECLEDDCEEDQMPAGPCPPIKIENGILYWWQCCEWIEVGTMQTIAPVSAPYSQEDPQPDFYACGKAAAAVDALIAVADNAWDEIDDPPWQWVGHVEAALPGYDLNNAKCVSAVINAIAASVTYDKVDLIDPAAIQNLKFRLSNSFLADSEGMQAAQFNVMKNQISDLWPSSLATVLHNSADAIGLGQFEQITALAATDSVADCYAPEQGLADPTADWQGLDWSHWWDFTIRAPKSWMVTEGSPGWISGLGLVDYPTVPGGGCKVGSEWTFSHEDGGIITHIWMLYRVSYQFDYVNHMVWVVTEQNALADITNTPDSDPSAGGYMICAKYTVNEVVGVADNSIHWEIEGAITDPIEADPRSPVLLACAVGGTGLDPYRGQDWT